LKSGYLQEKIVPGFLPLIEQKILSCIYDNNFQIVVCTNHSAQSVGLNHWEEAVGKSYADIPAIYEKVYDAEYVLRYRKDLEKYAAQILEMQKLVFIHKQVISFFDVFPYDETFKSHVITYVPLFDTNKEVIGFQSFAHKSRLLCVYEYFINSNGRDESLITSRRLCGGLTKREEEILFLLANRFKQDEIAKILKITRSTVATIIANQLCVKFNIPRTNTALLTRIAMDQGYSQYIPKSLFRPFAIPLIEEINREQEI